MERKVRVDDPATVAVTETLVGFRVAAGPAGATVADRETVPAKLLRLDIVIVEVVDEPASTTSEVEDAETLKSFSPPTEIVIVTERDKVPLTPVTTTE